LFNNSTHFTEITLGVAIPQSDSRQLAGQNSWPIFRRLWPTCARLCQIFRETL